MRGERTVILAGLMVGFSGMLWGEVTIRGRVIEVEPEAYVRLFWTWGGQGLGGDPVSGEWTAVKPAPPTVSQANAADEDPLLKILEEKPQFPPVLIEQGDTYDYHWLRKGVWSPELTPESFRNGRLYFLTVYANGCEPGDYRKRVALRRAVFEFEIREGGKTVKTFREESPSGAVATIIVPLRFLEEGRLTPFFLEHARGLSALIRWRRGFMEGLPWAKDPVPRQYEMLTDCGGYGTQHGYGVRTSNKAVLYDEFAILRQMGVNGLRGRPSFFLDDLKQKRLEVAGFERVTTVGFYGYPFEPAPVDHKTGKLRPLPWPEGAGCPYHPRYTNREAEAKAQFEELIRNARAQPFETWWCLTVDEIGSAFDRTGEGKAHMSVCPHCVEAFRDFLRAHGVTPADFGVADWAPIRPTFGYFEKSHAEKVKEAEEAFRRSLPGMNSKGADWKAKGGEEGDAETLLEGAEAALKAPPAETEAVDMSDEEAARAAERRREIEEGIGTSPTPLLSGRAWNLLYYWSRRFNNEGSARLFTPMRELFAEANANKKRAILEGRLDSPEARQPWMFLYALRGNTFLMGGHSLDFFDWYRHSDHGFMYETSNRDPRVWQWDSYLCDVGRILRLKLGHEFGIYVKPHRGAAIQRALSAVARGVRCIYWYTYGPDWSKGDTFGGNTAVMARVSRAARLIGAAEPVTWEGEWAVSPSVAVVRPLTAEYFGNSAQWEDGKWVYTALTHAHLPLEALDEGFLMTEDLSRYRAIYVTGSHIRKDVAARLAQYVKEGGTLFTGCGGLARDESNSRLTALYPIFGVTNRSDPVLWGKVPRYGATALGNISLAGSRPESAGLAAEGGPIPLKVGWERLQPVPGAEVVLQFADGSPALLRNRYGKGTAWLAAWYSGVEYAAGVMKSGYDMARDFDPRLRYWIVRAALESGAVPDVEPSEPLIEAVRIRSKSGDRQAVVVMNWAYASGRDLIEFPNATLRLPSGEWKGVYSVWQRRRIPVRKEGDKTIVPLGLLEDGDVLLLE